MTTINILIIVLGLLLLLILFLTIEVFKLNFKIKNNSKLIENKNIAISKHIRSLEISEEIYKNYKKNIKNKIEKLSINSLHDLRFYLNEKYRNNISRNDIDIISSLYFKAKRNNNSLEKQVKILDNIDKIIELLKENTKN